jgi:hypothetical protein
VALLRTLRSRLTYANVVASIALFVALGGSSYAAVQLSKNSVKSKHIGSGQVRTGDIRGNAVTTSKIRNGTLELSDFNAQVASDLRGAAGPQGPGGAQGPQGAGGEAGAAGPSGSSVSRLHWAGTTTVGNNTQAPLLPPITRTHKGDTSQLYTGRASITAPSDCPGGGNMDVIVYETQNGNAERILERRVSFSDVPAGETRTVELASRIDVPGLASDPEPGSDTQQTFDATSLDYCSNSSNWTINSLDVSVIGFR